MIALHLALKDLRLLSRDPVALFWVLGFPLLFALFLGGVVRAGLRGEPGPLQVVIVNEAKTPVAARLVDTLGRSDRLVVRSDSRERGQRAVRRAEAVAYLELPAGFGEAAPAGDGAGVTEFAVGAPLRLGIDPSREVEGAFVRSAILRALEDARGDATEGPASARGEPPMIPIALTREETRREADLVFPAAVLWGLIGCAACFAISMVTERTQGTFLRLIAAPVETSVLLWGKALACLLACATVAVVLTTVAVVVFGVRFEQPLRVLAALSSAAVCFVGITMLLSLLGRTEQAVAGAGWAVLILMAMIGGGMVPLSMMPTWLLSVSHLSPAKWSILALEGATWRAFTPIELLLPCGILVAIGALGFGVGARLLSRMAP